MVFGAEPVFFRPAAVKAFMNNNIETRSCNPVNWIYAPLVLDCEYFSLDFWLVQEVM